MSEIGDIIQGKCLAFGDRVIKLNDYLLEQGCQMEEVRCKKSGGTRIPKFYILEAIILLIVNSTVK